MNALDIAQALLDGEELVITARDLRECRTAITEVMRIIHEIKPTVNYHRHRITMPSGARATFISRKNSQSLRGIHSSIRVLPYRS